jgi:type II secretory pathway pseudopilin PulG
MTLIELLVVVTIVVMLTASAVPLMRPAIRDAQLREAARQLNVFCTVAKGRAREIGRPAGLWIERSAAGGNAAFEVYIAEEPLPYSGDFADAVAEIGDFDTSPAHPYLEARFTVARNTALLTLISEGDYIQFARRGPRYLINQPPWSAGGYYLVSLASPYPASTTGVGLPYKFYRQPRKSSLPSLQFAGGTVIDLEHSGVGAANALFNAADTNQPNDLTTQPVILMFEPGGSVSRVYTRFVNGLGNVEYSGQRANATTYLLVGRFEQTTPPPDSTTAVSPPATSEQTNLADVKNVWISINSKTGTVSSSENLGGTLAVARTLSRSAQSMGGN